MIRRPRSRRAQFDDHHHSIGRKGTRGATVFYKKTESNKENPIMVGEGENKQLLDPKKIEKRKGTATNVYKKNYNKRPERGGRNVENEENKDRKKKKADKGIEIKEKGVSGKEAKKIDEEETEVPVKDKVVEVAAIKVVGEVEKKTNELVVKDIIRNVVAVIDKEYDEEDSKSMAVNDKPVDDVENVNTTEKKVKKTGKRVAKELQANFVNLISQRKQVGTSKEKLKVVFCDMESDSASDHEKDSKSQRGPTIKSKANKGKTVVTYNKRGVPIRVGAKKLATFEGVAARSMVPITYDRWFDVGEETKEACWKYVSTHFVLNPKSRKYTLQSIGTKWKNFKHHLYKKFIRTQKDDPEADLLTPPSMYPFLKIEDWKLFVEQRISRKWEDKSKKAKNICWKRARELKKGGFDQNVENIVDKVEELQKTKKNVEDPHQYSLLPKTAKSYLDNEKKKMDQRLIKVEDELQRLKRGIYNNVSEGAGCQMWGDEDVEDKAPEEGPLDNSCYLAVDVPSNIVAKGTVLNYSVSGENVEVMMELCVQGEALLPIPLKEEFIEKVKDALGCILSWPRHLVIRCSYLNKMVAKNAKKDEERKNEDKNAKKDEERNTKKRMEKEKKIGKELESTKGKKRQREPDEEDKKELIIIGKMDDKNCGLQLITDDINELEARKTKVNEKETVQRRMTRGQRKSRIRMEKSVALKMVALMVDGQVSKVDSIKVQCENDLFGYESYTYLTWNDFDKVFTMDEVSGAVVISYTMYLYEQIKNMPKRDHGICFMTPSATMQHERKAKAKNVDDSSRLVADRLSTRKDNDIILLPYNPGRHWVLGVLDMKTSTCYFLDSLRPRSVNPQFRQIVDAAIGLYDVQSGSKKMTKLNWVNSRCPCQPGSTECGYYMLKFMKEIVQQGFEVLENDNIGGNRNEYTNDDFDEIREEWATYVANFIFRDPE
ncbi:hypothetical protein SSX86_027278 [Deinandra increscens subsp. villosa]|uniref:Ubiquitin-like protease family profile domain-containing protein n=1 Tax=Deinandra increscens subsp. villosa TaxID=3103831 RepID=A0AAP0GQ02_9ASTR